MPVDSNAWVTLNNSKEQLHLGISETDFDDQLTNLVNRSYKILEAYIGQQIKSDTYTEFYDGDDTGKIVLRKWPIISVTSIHIDIDRDFTSDTLAAAGDYYVDTEHGIVEFFQSEGSGPSWFEPGIKNVKIIYMAGYTTVPVDLVQAGVMHVAWLFRRSATEATTTQALGGKSESYEMEQIPKYIRIILDRYKIHSV